MSMRTVLKGDRGELALEILDYENPRAQSVEDSNWLRANLTIQAGPFSGSIEFGLTTDELAVLSSQLSTVMSSLSGQVRFATMEGNWMLNVDFERSGTAIVSGMMTSNRTLGNKLLYELRADPIALEPVVGDVARMTSMYPVRSAP